MHNTFKVEKGAFIDLAKYYTDKRTKYISMPNIK